jgi:DNA-binding transcriptional MocR family regulator
MQGKINTSFATYQADLFESGLVAQIGPNAFAVWSAIKAHADFQTGVSWPSIRRLMELTGLASATVQKCLTVLEEHRLLRSEVKNKRRYYLARERLDIHLGSRVICTIVVDYVPASMRVKIGRIKDALATGENDEEAFAACEIIPGSGFVWDDKEKVLRGSLAASEMPSQPESLSDLARPIVERAKRKALPKN